MEKESIYYATGKRKNAIARTWLKPGSGRITVNDLPMEEYVLIESLKLKLRAPLVLTNKDSLFDVTIRVSGGGVSGQADAMRHGITKALIIADPDLRETLKRAGFIKRDSRIKERKKYGQKAARARFQFSKR